MRKAFFISVLGLLVPTFLSYGNEVRAHMDPRMMGPGMMTPGHGMGPGMRGRGDYGGWYYPYYEQPMWPGGGYGMWPGMMGPGY